MGRIFTWMLLGLLYGFLGCGDDLTPADIKQCEKYCDKMQECDRVSPPSDSERDECVTACSAVAVGGSNTTIDKALTECASLDDCDAFLECALENVEPLWDSK